MKLLLYASSMPSKLFMEMGAYSSIYKGSGNTALIVLVCLDL